MTIKGLQKLVSQHPGSLIIINELADGEIVRQYISVWGQGVYPADGLPTLDEESILALLDVPTDKRKSWTVKSVPMEGMWARILEDNAEGDKEAMELPVRLIDETAELKFFETFLGERPLAAIYPEYLKPVGLTREHSYWTRELISNEKNGREEHAADREAWLPAGGGHQPAGALGRGRKEFEGPAPDPPGGGGYL